MTDAANKNDKLYLAVNNDSQLGKLLQRLAQNPAIRTTEVCEKWSQNARGGGKTALSPTRGSFILDALANATEVREDAFSPAKGTYLLRGVREALTTSNPGKAIPLFEERKQTIVVDQGAVGKAKDEEIQKLKAEVARLEAHAGTLKAELQPAPKPVSEGEQEVNFVWPDKPVMPAAMPNFVKPDWYDDMAAALDAGKHVAISGPPGTGKSTGAEQYFIKRGQPFVTVNGDAGLRRRDLTGSVELANGTTRFVVAEYAAAAILGWGVIINEVNAADADALLFLNGQMATPFTVNLHGKSFPVHKNFRLVVTFNPGLYGTKPLPQSFRDRFMPSEAPFPGTLALRKMLVANGTPEMANYLSSLLKFAAEAWAKHERGVMRYQISPRRLFDVSFLIEKRGRSLKEAIQRAVIIGVDSKPDRAQLEQAMTAAGIY